MSLDVYLQDLTVLGAWERREGQAANIRRDVINASACELSHETNVLNSFGGAASFITGSKMSLTPEDRSNWPTPLTSP